MCHRVVVMMIGGPSSSKMKKRDVYIEDVECEADRRTFVDLTRFCSGR